MNETTTELFVQYREYVAKCEKNGVYAPTFRISLL
jgi:hypothetical protein